jgi:CP family cyanate transporter-like MFS transporter
MASMGPLAVGLVHDRTGTWNTAGWIFAVIGGAAIVAGLGAGRARYVQATSEELPTCPTLRS